MKKEALLILIVLLNISFASALINETKQIDNAYKWLENSVGNNWQNLNTLQHETALLALSYKSVLKNQGLNYLRQKGWPIGNPVCWGQTAVNNENQCKIKETAIASFIYSEFDLDYSKINEWLLNHSALFKDIQWYLQVDIERGLNATCNVTYKGGQAIFIINKNKEIEIGTTPSPCLRVYESNWLEIDKSCYDKDFKITCSISDATKTYKVGFLYKEDPTSNEWFASDFSYSIESGSYVDVSIKDISICLKDPQGQCNYEANAIAAYTLKQEGNSQYAALMPYLVINAKANINKNSNAWLYLITGNEKYGNNIIGAETAQGFWLISGFGQFYDTAVNAYALIQNYNGDYSKNETMQYLLERQNKQGFWQCNEGGCDKIRDTAMLLYVFWPQAIAGGVGNETYVSNACEDVGGFCDFWCDPSLNYIENPTLSYECGNMVCCVDASSLSCSDPLINGQICQQDEQCVGGTFIATIDSPEALCCYNGTCQAATQSCSEQGGFICDGVNNFCPSGYELAATDVGGNEVCCSIQCQSCEEIGGSFCESDEICSGQSIGDCCIGECVKNANCAELDGEICDESGWTCSGDLIATLDTDKCCVGDCIKSCEDEGGTICFEDEVCEGSEVEASDIGTGEICCIGECKKKGGFNFGLLIFFLIIIALAIAGYFLYKKGKLQTLFKKKEKPGPTPNIFKTKPMPPTTPAVRPMPKMPKIIPRTLPKATPKPIPITRPKLKPIEIPKEKPKEKVKAKSKTEEQLEKTLKKIKELTK